MSKYRQVSSLHTNSHPNTNVSKFQFCTILEFFVVFKFEFLKPMLITCLRTKTVSRTQFPNFIFSHFVWLLIRIRLFHYSFICNIYYIIYFLNNLNFLNFFIFFYIFQVQLDKITAIPKNLHLNCKVGHILFFFIIFCFCQP